MSNIDLNTCVSGQLVERRNGDIVNYIGRNKEQNTLYPHTVGILSYTDDGYHYASRVEDENDVVRILPLDKPEPPKPDTHPSVAWWESCPWITDRRPTEKDGNRFGQVMLQAPGEGRADTTCFMHWKYVKEGQTWIHSLNGSPLNQTPKEKALALIASHVCPWTPTLDDWILISEGLME